MLASWGGRRHCLCHGNGAAGDETMTQTELRKGIAAMQRVQAANPPNSEKWQRASVALHRMVKLLTGKDAQDAHGRG